MNKKLETNFSVEKLLGYGSGGYVFKVLCKGEYYALKIAEKEEEFSIHLKMNEKLKGTPAYVEIIDYGTISKEEVGKIVKLVRELDTTKRMDTDIGYIEIEKKNKTDWKAVIMQLVIVSLEKSYNYLDTDLIFQIYYSIYYFMKNGYEPFDLHKGNISFSCYKEKPKFVVNGCELNSVSFNFADKQRQQHKSEGYCIVKFIDYGLYRERDYKIILNYDVLSKMLLFFFNLNVSSPIEYRQNNEIIRDSSVRDLVRIIRDKKNLLIPAENILILLLNELNCNKIKYALIDSKTRELINERKIEILKDVDPTYFSEAQLFRASERTGTYPEKSYENISLEIKKKYKEKYLIPMSYYIYWSNFMPLFKVPTVKDWTHNFRIEILLQEIEYDWYFEEDEEKYKKCQFENLSGNVWTLGPFKEYNRYPIDFPLKVGLCLMKDILYIKDKSVFDKFSAQFFKEVELLKTATEITQEFKDAIRKIYPLFSERERKYYSVVV